MSAGPPINGELEARQARFDQPEPREAAINTAQATMDLDRRPKSMGKIDQIGITVPTPASERVHEIKIDKRDRVLVSVTSRGGQGVRAGLVIGALLVAFGLAWAGGSNWYRFFDLDAAPSTLLEPSARILDSKKGDRLQTGGVVGSTIRETGRQVIAEAPNSPKVSPPAASSRSDGHKPSAGAAQPAIASTNKVSPVGQQHTASIGPTTGGEQPRAKLTPTPDTRPTTIEGWTVREVIDGTAILEGPSGSWKATRGDTVPGVGKVYTIVRWGSRWIVATSRGLITTQ